MNHKATVNKVMNPSLWGALALGMIFVLPSWAAAQSQQSQGGDLLGYGKQLISNTAAHIGPDVKNPEMRYAGNNLNCQSCHLAAATKPFSAPYAGVAEEFPMYRGREGKVVPVESRVNGCMERSMNGKALPNDSREMKAIVAYMEDLSAKSQPAAAAEVRGFGAISIPERPVNLAQGEEVFKQHCVSCHQADGQGMPKDAQNPSQGYLYPPLWGEGSYNLGAGMARVMTAAAFIRSNMPFGSTYEQPVLSDEDAYDVAGYINSKPRPVPEGLAQDYPKLYQKPADSPYGPYADTFSAKQHRVGPFQPIEAALKALEPAKKGN